MASPRISLSFESYLKSNGKATNVFYYLSAQRILLKSYKKVRSLLVHHLCVGTPVGTPVSPPPNTSIACTPVGTPPPPPPPNTSIAFCSYVWEEFHVSLQVTSLNVSIKLKQDLAILNAIF